MKESVYQARVTQRLKDTFPGCVVLRNDASVLQGIPDLLVLFNEHWAALEVKTSAKAAVQPNQRHYVERLDEMNFAAFIYPENEEEVFGALQESFGLA